MSKNYNSTLQNNNSSLEEIIQQLHSLPDASGGGSVPEICNVQIAPFFRSGGTDKLAIFYTTIDQNYTINSQCIRLNDSTTTFIQAPRYSFIAIVYNDPQNYFSEPLVVRGGELMQSYHKDTSWFFFIKITAAHDGDNFRDVSIMINEE
jgi:hypothetical protein